MKRQEAYDLQVRQRSSYESAYWSFRNEEQWSNLRARLIETADLGQRTRGKQAVPPVGGTALMAMADGASVCPDGHNPDTASPCRGEPSETR